MAGSKPGSKTPKIAVQNLAVRDADLELLHLCTEVRPWEGRAMLPWRGEAGMLFGRVLARQGRTFVGPLDTIPSGAEKLPTGLRPSELIVQDEHTCDPTWGKHDHHGHGTEMAGVALYGDLATVLASRSRVVLEHRIESVKLLRPTETTMPSSMDL